jgi:hypothetical protein
VAAIASNGTGGGNWSSGASWAGGVVPTVADTVTIAAGDTITVDTTGLGALTLQLNGILTWAAGSTTSITFGNGSSDTIITFGAGGYWRAGTVATPLTGLHTVTIAPLSTSLTSVYNNFNMAACNTVTSGCTIVCDRTVYGVAESYTHPITGVVYPTRRNFTQLSAQVNTAQALAVLAEDLQLRAGGGDGVYFPGSHATTNGVLNAGQIRTTASYNSGTRTITATANFTTQIALNTIAGVASSGARCYSELSIFTITANANTKYWGITGASSSNALFELQNATLRYFTGNANTFTQFNNRAILGCVLIGTAAAVTGSSLRHASGAVQWISCVIDAYPNQNFGAQFYYNCFFTQVVRTGFDYLNVMGSGSAFFDCYFQDIFQVIANTSGVYLTRCGGLNVQNFAGGLQTDCWSIATVNFGGDKNLRCIFGRSTNATGTVTKPTIFELCQIVTAPTNIFVDVNTRTSPMLFGFASGWIAPSGAGSPSSVGIKCAPGGNTLGYTSPPDVIAVPPSGSTIYNRLVTTAAIAPTVAGEPFRAALHEYQFLATSGVAYSFTVPILSVSGYTPTSLTSIRLVLTWANGAQVTTTVSSLTANVWNMTNVAGVAPVSGACTVQVYIQANIGSVYVDYPLDCDPAGYRWTNGQPQVSQTRLQDSSAGTVALAVWSQATGTNSAGSRGARVDALLTESVFVENTG